MINACEKELQVHTESKSSPHSTSLYTTFVVTLLGACTTTELGEPVLACATYSMPWQKHGVLKSMPTS